VIWSYRLNNQRLGAISGACGLAPERVRYWCVGAVDADDQESAEAHQRWLEQAPAVAIAAWVTRREAELEQLVIRRASPALTCIDLDADDEAE
jgi:hypothetical protein